MNEKSFVQIIDKKTKLPVYEYFCKSISAEILAKSFKKSLYPKWYEVRIK
jgi:hypothetical protein